MRTIYAAARTQTSAPVTFPKALRAFPKALRALAGTPARVLLKMLDAYLAWVEVHRQRRALLALSDDMLKDIGISRSQADFEGSKPFWRD
jgi:uncharacterized protein YjiS (DUF1127 family)